MTDALSGSPPLVATGVELAGSASAFPLELDTGRELANDEAYATLLGEDWERELERRGWSAEHLERALGVRRRQWLATPGRPETAGADAGDLALAAARKALDDAGLAPGEVDLCVVATSSPPRISSTLAGRVGRELGIDAACLDLRVGGAGGLAAWCTACAHLKAGATHALVVATEALSPLLDPADLASAQLFGDGAGALVLRRDEGDARGLVWSRSGNAHVPGRAFTVPGPLPPTRDLGYGAYAFQAPDADYARGLAELRAACARELAAAAAERGLAVDVALPYGATLPQLSSMHADLGGSLDASAATLAEHGCLGAAAPLVALDRARRTDSTMGLAPGTTLAATAAGGGVAWCSLLWTT